MLANILSIDVKPLAKVPVEIIVYGRNDTRAADEAVLRFAGLIGANARATFHIALDDSLIKDYVGALKPFLAKLNVSEDDGEEPAS